MQAVSIFLLVVGNFRVNVVSRICAFECTFQRLQLDQRLSVFVNYRKRNAASVYILNGVRRWFPVACNCDICGSVCYIIIAHCTCVSRLLKIAQRLIYSNDLCQLTHFAKHHKYSHIFQNKMIEYQVVLSCCVFFV